MTKSSRSKLKPAGGMIILLVVLLLFSACSGGVHSRFVELEMHLASPYFGEYMRLPVVYPGGPAVHEKPVMQDYGPSWRSLEHDYSAYNFNP